MTTLQPRQAYTEEELRKLYPAGLELQLVQILLRHGERTPVSARFQNAGLRPFWPYCKVVRRLRSGVLGSQGYTALEWRRRLETFGEDDAAVVATGPRGEADDVCDMGSLTDVGRETTLALGGRLRHLYVDRLRFLPPTMSSPDFLYLRATPIPRALESLQQTFTGLYPVATRVAGPDGALPPPTILTRAQGDETLFPNDSNCRRFAALSRAFAQRTAGRWNGTDDMAYLNSIYGRWMPGDSPRVAVDSHPRLSGIMDTVNSTLAHGPETRLPKQFYDRKARDIMERVGVEEWFSGYAESREYRMLGIGALMGDVVARMVGGVERRRSTAADGEPQVMHRSGQDGTAIRFGLSGCHDTTLAAVLASMGAFAPDKWPPYTSHVAVELFRDATRPPTAADGGNNTVPPSAHAAAEKATSWFGSPFGSSPRPPSGIGRRQTGELTAAEKSSLDGYYVRLRYNDEPVTIPGCKAPGNHLDGDESFCTLAAFKSIVDKFTPKDWRQQCASNFNQPAFPSKPEPAGY